MFPTTPIASPGAKHRPRVLVVDDEPELLELMTGILGGLDCRVSVAKSIAGAKKMLIGESFELMLADVHLPDGDGLSLLSTLRRHQPTASAVVMTGSPSVDGAISALRSGAIDFVPKPFNNTQLIERIGKALARQTVAARQEKRLVRLRDAVRRLSVARRMVTKKVDLLCNDLVSAYGELSRQLDFVRTQESFRKQIEQTNDLEQMLCHTMDWMIRQIGYSNIALWLAGEDSEFQLGAYMKYTVSGEEPLMGAMRELLLHRTINDGFLHIGGDEISSHLENDAAAPLRGQDIVTVSCTYLAEPLAAMVFFRDAAAPFTENDIATLKAIAPVFAATLATIVRDPSEEDEGDTDLLDEDPDSKRSGRRADDWWKRGEPPPF